ncbi:MAG TPA: N-acyl homoserine lactonase family protein [Armatimonadota bacterium]|nr:N-acyl homoserine lactonase family protein [Armatimonadota bacterium]
MTRPAIWRRSVKYLAPTLLLVLAAAIPVPQAPEYSIQAIRFADSFDDAVDSMVMGAPADERIDTVYAFWLIRGGGRNILFDTGFYRDRWFELWTVENYLRPDEAVRLAGVEPEEITDVVISHAHWDHLGGIDLFPKATVWIQSEEFRYYTGHAWQPGGNHGGIDPDDIRELVRINTEGRLRLVDGDDQEILPGIRAYTGARHTYASQYLQVGNPPIVLTSDNVYLYRNLTDHRASATFSDADHAANVAAHERMIQLAGSADRIVPGHDVLQFERFPTQGRIARIR